MARGVLVSRDRDAPAAVPDAAVRRCHPPAQLAVQLQSADGVWRACLALTCGELVSACGELVSRGNGHNLGPRSGATIWPRVLSMQQSLMPPLSPDDNSCIIIPHAVRENFRMTH